MKIKVIKDFSDKKEKNVLRKAGDDFIASKERFEEMTNNFKNLGLDPKDYIEEIKEVKASKK